VDSFIMCFVCVSENKKLTKSSWKNWKVFFPQQHFKKWTTHA